MHAVIHLLQLLIKKLGLPEWTIFFVIVPIMLIIGVGAVFVRRKYFQVLKRKLKPYPERQIQRSLKGFFDLTIAGQGAKIDQEIMTKYAPVVPNYDIGVFILHGSKVGGTFLSPLYANANLIDAYYTG